ncbi:MAG TPA: BON domain-containing protein [Puia sp.]|nr:BON domain-containing protein [Puia sp.]
MNKKPLKRAAILLSIFFLLASITSCGVKDSTIQEKISEATKTTPELSSITSAVKDGVVTLSGEVKDDAAKATCETVIKAIKGVKSVASNITIAPPPPVQAITDSTDDALKKGVTDATKDFPSVKADVADGMITLTGDLKRNSLPKLLQSLSTLKPKKIDNKLTLK